jgi:hypothetical protein
VLSQQQILSALEERGVRPVEIQRVLELPSSRVAEMQRAVGIVRTPGKSRRMSLDEAITLVEAFDLEGERELRDPLPIPIAGLAVDYVADALGVPVPDDLRNTVAADISALAALAGEPSAREAVAGLRMFLDGLAIRRKPPAEQRSRTPRVNNQ